MDSQIYNSLSETQYYKGNFDPKKTKILHYACGDNKPWNNQGHNIALWKMYNSFAKSLYNHSLEYSLFMFNLKKFFIDLSYKWGIQH